MTREEEKYQAAENAWQLKGIKNKEQKIPYKLGFLEGFDYADQHPRKGLWDSEKVVEWILNNYETYEQTYLDNSGNHTYSDFQVGQFIRNLRKAMED